MDKETAIRQIKGLEASFCRICATYPEIRSDKGAYQAGQFCLNECAIGGRIQNLGGYIEYGVNRSMMTAPEFTKDAYLEAYEEGLRDWQIRERFGISANTLKRRKAAWNLIGTYNDHRSEPRSTRQGKELTKDIYLDMISQEATDREIREQFGISRDVLYSRKTEWGIKYSPKYAEFSREEYHYHKGRGLTDSEIAETWDVGNNTLLRMKKRWNLVYVPLRERYSKTDYQTLKAQGMNDERVLEKWDISRNSLRRLKSFWSKDVGM